MYMSGYKHTLHLTLFKSLDCLYQRAIPSNVTHTPIYTAYIYTLIVIQYIHTCTLLMFLNKVRNTIGIYTCSILGKHRMMNLDLVTQL